ncbi:MAG TPA: hypothetical protein ACFYDZ_00305 [Candidatus Brocadiaceae bacterium]
MSEEKKELSPLEQLKSDLQNFMVRRDQAQANLQQLIGAIFATEQAIQRISEPTEEPSVYSGE